MPRKPREDYPGAWHHVMNRGRNRNQIFRSDDDILEFLDALADTVDRTEIEVHAYSLMPNHYHLLVRSKLGNISAAIKHMSAMYTQRFNLAHKTDGALFKGRFKSQLILHEPYLIYLLAYIHLNPLKANLVTRLDLSRSHTSFRRYMGKDKNLTWLSTDYFLNQFKSPKELEKLILGIHRKSISWPEGMRKSDGWFKWHLCPVDIQKAINPQIERVPVKELLDNICAVTDTTRKQLTKSIRGPVGNPERRFAVWALNESTLLTHAQIGKLLNMTAQHVARDISRTRNNLDSFEEWIVYWKDLYPSKTLAIL